MATMSRNSAERSLELTARTAFYVFALTNLVAAIFAPIQDCDEVFNYWEPSHYLNHGHGLQTWEYSPEYAIRSWTYTGLHSLLMWLGILPLRILRYNKSTVAEFYFLRATLALTCAFCQTRLYSVIARTFHPRVAIFFMVALVISPGMYHAAPAYLPSSFAMYATMLGLAAFMKGSGGLAKTAQGIAWFGIGSVLGWPFAGALVIPFVVEEIIIASVTGEVFEAFWRLFQGAGRSLVVLALQTAIDSWFYKKLVCVPLNIVLYNVFSGGSRGPDIYGVEPWHFYVRNLALNFNIWFFLALASLPLLLVQHIAIQKAVSRQTLLRSLVFVSPFYLWLAIFTLQPHKEERFMYPAYPALALNAAIALHIILTNLGSTDPRHLVSKLHPQLKLAIVAVPLLLSFNVGMLRTIGTLTGYSAPLNVYKPLHDPTIARPGDTVCLGKEWYRFPSSFNLPHGVRAKFIKSEFSGLLPGEFSQANVGFGLFPGTWLVPLGMNDENVEDPGKYIDVEHCDFLVDSSLPGTSPTELEPDYISDTERWKTLKCLPFLDASQTHLLGRLLWVPDLPFVPAQLRRKWGNYCLLQRKAIPGTLRLTIMSTLGPRFAEHARHLARTARHHCINVQAKINTAIQHVDINPKAALYAGLLFMTCVWLAITITNRMRHGKRNSTTRPNTPNLERRTPFKAAERPPGVWIPQPFTRPTASPYPSWSLKHTKPLPYRPFKHGPKYHITMGLRTMSWDEWIELDNQYLSYHALKAERIQERGSKCCKTAPEAWGAAVELVGELCGYLPERYPGLFRRLEGREGEGMRNLITGEVFDVGGLRGRGRGRHGHGHGHGEGEGKGEGEGEGEDPMTMCARMVQDDLAIMMEGKDGQYYLVAGAILLAGFWRLEDKFGMGLSEIHTSGDVPGFKEKLEKGMTNFFRRVKPEGPVLRNNYFIQVDDKLAWSESIGSEDAEEGIGWFTAEKNKAIQHHWFRCERQSLRRLPKSGGVVFTIRTYFHPITSICAEPYVPGRLASAIRSWGDDVSRYKGKERYGEVLLEYLDQRHKEQVEGGLVVDSEIEEGRGYPF
ncbi:hypothetical protein EJ02DRAFT_504697 [Clathrospora elynae]|uniref:Mannosyltransferase n=1 Tax=Clathrospora elynae TaxID=706981 RepID=A0A6A5SHL1_9PLEO|nr:hypothetical protein EJ02DRAFT_504697 [Clathrospora elynae]